MEDNTNQTRRSRLILLLLGALIAAALVGWWLGQKDDDKTGGQPTQTQSQTRSDDARAFIGYELPANWSEAECNSGMHLGPGSRDCDASPAAPIRIYIDPDRNTDCNSLDPATGVQKHICKSIFVDGRKTLQAETVEDGTTTRAYYINTGDAVAVVEYVFTTSNDYEAQLDQIIKSVKVGK